MFGISTAEVKLVKEFLASRTDNKDYLEALDDMAGLLCVKIEDNIVQLYRDMGVGNDQT